VSDNVQTPGLKLWTFGKQSLTTDISKSDQWLRPTIEMWHGITAEFWNRGTMTANEVRQWSQRFFPTFGMKEVTAASENGVLYLSTSKGASETTLNVTATLTLPKQTVKAVLRLNDTAVAEQDVVVSATEATTVTATVANSKVASGAVLKAEFLQADKSLLSGQITLP
jgi:type IV secretory pathway TraG/TraD family ATPase VirD4